MEQFDGPIPGQSLTRPPGNAPYEQPPQFTQVDEAMDFLIASMTAPEQAVRLIGIMDAKIPVSAVVRMILMQGFVEQKWNPDLALLLIEPISALLITMAKQAGVKPTNGASKDSAKEFFLQLEANRSEDPEEAPEAQPELPMKGGMMSPKQKFLAGLKA